MRTLVYKRTHVGDPDSRGIFGVADCMGRVRDYDFDAVIGVGGAGLEPTLAGISGKVNWIGIGPRRIAPRDSAWRSSMVTFDHFLLFEIKGPELTKIAPA